MAMDMHTVENGQIQTVYHRTRKLRPIYGDSFFGRGNGTNPAGHVLSDFFGALCVCNEKVEELGRFA